MRRAALFLALATLAFPGAASASPVGPGRPAPPVVTPTTTTPNPLLTPPLAAPAPTASPDPNAGTLGTPDLFSQADVNCQNLAGATLEVVQNCRSDSQPRSAYPASNYGLDVHVDTGLTSPAGDVDSVFQNLLSALFQGLSTVVGAILSILGFAFGFDVFRAGIATINRVLAIEVNGFTLPLMPLALVVLGWVLTRHLWRRDEARVVGHTLVAVLLIGVGLVIALSPAGTLGELDAVSHAFEGAAIGMFSGTNSQSGYANSEPTLWKTAIETPWCTAEFGSPTWCNAPVDPAMAAARDDVIANHLPEALGGQSTPQEAAQQAPLEKMRLLDARTNGEIFLSFVNNANARNGANAPWSFYNVVKKEHPDLLAIRGPGGYVQRGIILFFGLIVGTAFLLLILYVTLQLVVNSFIVVACLLGSPVAVLLPVTESGQYAFRAYLGWLFLAFIRGVIYAGYLGLVIVLANLVGQIAAGWGFVTYWFLLTVVFGAAFYLRRKPMELLGIREHPHPTQQLRYAAATGAGILIGRVRRRGNGGGGAEEAQPPQTNVYQHHQHAHLYMNDRGERPGPHRVRHQAGDIEGEVRHLEE